DLLDGVFPLVQLGLELAQGLLQLTHLLRIHRAELAPRRAGRRHNGVDGFARLCRTFRRLQPPPQRQGFNRRRRRRKLDPPGRRRRRGRFRRVVHLPNHRITAAHHPPFPAGTGVPAGSGFLSSGSRNFATNVSVSRFPSTIRKRPSEPCCLMAAGRSRSSPGKSSTTRATLCWRLCSSSASRSRPTSAACFSPASVNRTPWSFNKAIRSAGARESTRCPRASGRCKPLLPTRNGRR